MEKLVLHTTETGGGDSMSRHEGDEPRLPLDRCAYGQKCCDPKEAIRVREEAAKKKQREEQQEIAAKPRLHRQAPWSTKLSCQEGIMANKTPAPKPFQSKKASL